MDGLVTENYVVDQVLDTHRTALRSDYDGYRNHIYRVASFFNQLGPERFDSMPALAVAAAFHDLGIWASHTFDYLEPSSRLARDYLETEGITDIDPFLVHELIVQHHKLSDYRTRPWASVVNQWRKADLVDLSLGVIALGIPRSCVRNIQMHLPDRGFHRRLLTLTLRQFVKTPWNPLPMMRW